MPRFGSLALAVIFLISPNGFTQDQKINREDLKPGLVLTADDDGERISRLEPTVAISLAKGESAHPRLTAGNDFVWEGAINILIPGKYQFDANLLGKLTVSVNGEKVFESEATGADPKQAKSVVGPELDLPAGIHPFRAELKRTGDAVRAELIWQGPMFQAEPVPYFFFGHLPAQRPEQFGEMVAQEHGRFLFEELSCKRCHTPAADDKVAATLAERAGPDLSEIGKRVYPGWLDAWLADPQKLRPHTTMPQMFADDEQGQAERYAVVAYLAGLGGPMPKHQQQGNANQQRQSRDRGSQLFLSVGCAACHGDKVNQAKTVKKNDDFDFEDDDKPAWQPSDSFHALGTEAVGGYYRLGAVGSKTTPGPLAAYLQNPAQNNPHGRMPSLLLNGGEANDLANFLCMITDDQINKAMPKAPEFDRSKLAAKWLPGGEREAFGKRPAAEQWKRLGESLMTAKGCVNCHTVSPGNKPLPTDTGLAPELAKARTNTDAGCLSTEPKPDQVPVYPLKDAQKVALKTFLQVGLNGAGSDAPLYQARVSLKRFQCLNCHNRDGEGGIDEALTDIMKVMANAENAEDLLPPKLTGAGHKLRTPWLKQVLVQAGRARPWMAMRMPQYGEANVGFLTESLPALEGAVTDDTVKKPEFTAAKLEAGRKLAGKAGLGCIACHDISGIAGGGTRGPDLATTNQRVRHDWYVRWMHQPQRVSPGTRMPQNFINGRSQLDTILNGDGDAQIEALWAYFSLGPGLPLPEGIEPPGQALVVKVGERPEILRTFMPHGTSSKAVAVGYPGGMNLVFDAANSRLGYAWTGNFIDAAPVWNNRGGRPANLLGPRFWDAPAGHPWAITTGKKPDFAKQAENPAYGFQLPNDEYYDGQRFVRFLGYTLDTDGKPSFRYQLNDSDSSSSLLVVEKPVPMPVTIAAGLKRELEVRVPGGKQAWFNLGVSQARPKLYNANGEAEAQKPNQTAETIAVTGQHQRTNILLPQDGNKAVLAQVENLPDKSKVLIKERGNNQWEVLVQLPEATKEQEFEFQVTVWGLPQNDEQLLRELITATAKAGNDQSGGKQ